MGLLSRLRVRAAAEPKLLRDDEKPEKPVGASGTINYKGFLQTSEYNRDLDGKLGVKVWERMRRSDPAVRETLWHIYAAILNADWSVQPPPDADDREREITAFVSAVVFDWMKQPWPELLGQILTYLPIGHAVFEPQFMVVERELRVPKTETAPAGEGLDSGDATDTAAAEAPPVPPPSDAEPRTVPKRQYLVWRKFIHVIPTSIEKWNVARDGELESIEQMAAVTQPDGTQQFETIPIPAERLVVFVNEKWGDEWTGMSLLRSAYKPFFFKELIEKIAGIAFERYGVGVPVAYLPRGREGDVEMIEKIETMLKELRAGEFSYMVFPGPKAHGNVDGFDFEIVTPGAGGFPDFRDMLEYYRGEIKGAMLARFSELGHQQTGARATANVQSEVWYDALHAVARYIETQLDEAIRRLVDLNYPDVERYPKLHASDIEARSLLEFAQAVALLANAGALNMDTDTRAWVRDSVDAPAENAEEARALAEEAREQMQFERDLEVAQIETRQTETARPRPENTRK